MYTFPVPHCTNGTDPTEGNYILTNLDYDQNIPIPNLLSFQLSRPFKNNEPLDWSIYNEGTTADTGAGPDFPGWFAACSH